MEKKCNLCNKNLLHDDVSSFVALPRVLVLHLNRFKMSQTGIVKILSEVATSSMLDIGTFKFPYVANVTSGFGCTVDTKQPLPFESNVIVPQTAARRTEPDKIEDIFSFEGEDEQLQKVLKESLLEDDIIPETPEVDSQIEKALVLSLQENRSRQVTYHLSSVIQHHGSRATGGHYVTDVYDPASDTWVHCNDESTTTHKTLRLDQTGTYVLFYVHDSCWPKRHS